MNTDMVKTLRDTIQTFSKEKQLDVFKLCRAKDIFYTENKNGVFINLTELTTDQLYELQKHVNYINIQEKQINEVEKQKSEMTKLLSAE